MSEPREQKKKERPLKTLRESAGYSQEEFASLIGVHRSAITAYEARKKIPRFDNAVAMADKLGISLKTLAKAFGIDVSNIPND